MAFGQFTEEALGDAMHLVHCRIDPACGDETDLPCSRALRWRQDTEWMSKLREVLAENEQEHQERRRRAWGPPHWSQIAQM